jgi:choline kinase
MRGIIIAAGLGSRLGALTRDLPKCMLPFAGRPLLHHTMERMRAAGCEEMVVVVGHNKEKIDAPGAVLAENLDYPNNNILHSLFSAEPYLEGTVMVSYSEIWVEADIFRGLATAQGDVVLAVDEDWKPYYEGRTNHPLSEAEKIIIDGAGVAAVAGKGLDDEPGPGLACQEFLGLWKMEDAGCRLFREVFHELDGKLNNHSPFQKAKEWQKAYITDLIQELADRGHRVDTHKIQRGWAEIDTEQDYTRLVSIAERQKLFSLLD